MKKCSKCNQEKDYLEFSKSSYYPSGYAYRCKSCVNQASKESTAKRKDGLFRIYYLPKHNYIGYTSDIEGRMRAHKNTMKRDISNYSILGVYNNERDAKLKEAEYHNNGYNGRHPLGR